MTKETAFPPRAAAQGFHEEDFDENLTSQGNHIEIVWQIIIAELPDLALQIAKISVNNSTTNDES